MREAVAAFLRKESAVGILLMIATLAAMGFANSPLRCFYDLMLQTPLEVRLGDIEVAKPLLLWINDGLMAVFFLLIGLEVKRELLVRITSYNVCYTKLLRGQRWRRWQRAGGGCLHG